MFHTNKIIATVLLFSFVTITIICVPKSYSAANPTMHANFLTYENSSLGLQIQYPSNWKKLENAGNITFYPMTQNSSKGHILYPQLHIHISPSYNETLYQTANKLVNNYTKSTPAFKLHKLTPANTNGLLSELMLYNYTDPKSGFAKGTDVILTNNESNYYISYKASSSAFSMFLPVVYEMINSVRILAPGGSSYLEPMVSSQGPSSRLSVGVFAPDLLAQFLPTFPKETIRQYNFDDMTVDELFNLFSGLSSPDLVKLFDELPHNQVINLLSKIPVDDRSSILNKLPLYKHEQYLR